MTAYTYTGALTSAFAPVIEAAWKTSVEVKSTATAEPSHVARFIHGAPAGLASAIAKIDKVTAAAVRGTFCHQKPYVYWKGKNHPWPRKELADLLVSVQIEANGKVSSRALLVQLKMGDTGPWSRPIVLTDVDQCQRELYADLPPFCLVGMGQPTRAAAQAFGKDLDIFMKAQGAPAPYSLDSLPRAKLPAGMVYAAIDVDLGRVNRTCGPWIAEHGRPKDKLCNVNYDTPFAEALARMVAEHEENEAFGLRSDGYHAAPKDWARLIKDLHKWTDDRFLRIGKSTFSVKTTQKTPPRSVFDNLASASFVGNGRLLGLQSFAQASSQRSSDYHYWHSPLNPWRQMGPLRRDHRHDFPPTNDNDEWEENEDSSGFGILEFYIEVENGE